MLTPITQTNVANRQTLLQNADSLIDEDSTRRCLFSSLEIRFPSASGKPNISFIKACVVVGVLAVTT